MAKSNRQLLITLGADTTTFSQKVKRAKDLTKELDSNFKLLSSSSKNFESSLDGLSKKQDYLNDRIRLATTLNDTYNERLADQQDRLNKSTKSMEKLQKELDELKDAQQRSLDPQEWNDWQSEIDSVEDELKQVTKETKSFQDSVIGLNTLIDKNQTEIQKMNGELTETKIKFDLLSRDKTFEKMSKDISETDRQFENAKNSTDGFGNSVQDLTMQKKHYNRQMEKTQKLMDEYSVDIAKSKKEMEKLETVTESLTREVDAMNKAVEKMDGTEKHYKEWSDELDKLRAELTSNNRLLEIHKNRVETLTDSYKQSENSLESMRGKIKQTDNQLTQFGKKTQFAVIENALKSVRQEFEMMDSKLQLLRSEYVNFENSMIGVVRETKLLKQQTSTLRQEFQMQQNAITEYKTKINTLVQDYDKLGRKIKESKDSLEHMTEGSAEYNKTSIKIGEMEREFEELDNEIKEVTNDLRTMQVTANETLTSINNNIKAQHRSWDVAGEKMQSMGSKLQGLGGAMQGLGGAMMPLTASMTALGAGVIATGANFEQSMSKVKALSGATDEQFRKLEQTARDLGKSTVFSATDASEGLQYLALAGYSVQDSMDALPIILDSAVAGAMELGTASDLATDVLSSLGENSEFTGNKIKDLDQLMNQVAKTSTKSNTSMQQLLEAYIKVGGQVENMNIPLSTANTMLGILADKGIKAEEAGNSLNSILINLTKTGGESAKAMKELGVSAFDANGDIKPIEKTLGEMKKKLSGLSEQKQIQLINMIGGKTQAKTLQKLLQGIDADTQDFTEHYKGLRKEIEKSVDTKSLDNLRKTMEDNLTTDWKELESAFEEQLLTMFDGIAPQLRKIVQSMTDVIEELTKNDTLTNVFSSILDVVQKLIDAFAGLSPQMQENIIKFVAMGAILAPIVTVLGAVTSGAGSLLNGFGLLTSGTGKVVTKFGLLKEKGVTLKGFFTDFKGTVGTVASTMLGKLVPAVGGAEGAMTTVLSPAITALSSAVIPALIVALGGIVTSLGENEDALTWLQDKWGAFGTFVGGVLETLSGTFQLIFGGIGIQIKTVGQVIGKVLSGQWKEIDDVWNKGMADLSAHTLKASSDMLGESNKAIAYLRKVTANDIKDIGNIFEETFKILPTVTTQSVDEVAKSLSDMMDKHGTGVVSMSQKNLEILRGTSETMAVLFGGITADMDVDQATIQFKNSLNTMLTSGMTTTDELEKDFKQAGELIEKNLVDGTIRANQNATEVLEQFGEVASGNIESGVDDIVSVLKGLDTRGVETLRNMGTNWNAIFGNINDSSKMSAEEMKQAILQNLERLGLDTPEKLKSFQETLKTELDIATQNAGQDGKELGNEILDNIGTGAEEGTEVNGQKVKDATKSMTEKAKVGAKEGFEGLPESVKSELSKVGVAVDEQGNIVAEDMGKKGKQGAKAYIDEMNNELPALSGVAGTIKSQLDSINSVRFGGVTKQLSEINRWMGNVQKSASSTKSSLANIKTVTFGSTTKGLSEINKWLKDRITVSAKNTKKSLADIKTVTFGSTTKGLSEVNKWLKDRVSVSAESTRRKLQSVANVRFGGVTSSLSGVFNALDRLSSKANSTRRAVNRVINSAPRSIEIGVTTTEDLPLMRYTELQDVNISKFKTSGGFYEPTPIKTTTTKNRQTVDDSKVNSLLKATLEQNQLLLQLLNQQKPVEVAVNMDGRQVAKASAKYMESEINLINARKSRLGGK